MPGTELRHGQRHYRIEATIGAGGQGEVYRARDLKADTIVALKLPLHLGERATAQAAREIRLLRTLTHPVFPRLLDDFPLPGGEHILVMTFIDGADLGVQLRSRRTPFPIEQVLRWADMLLDGLAAIHQQNIIHRDIKPDNLKAAGDEIMLLDLGLAKELDTTTTVTIPGLTPAYAPIEQLDLDELDPRSDLYALAATLYHLLTGVLPAHARKRQKDVARGLADPLQPAHECPARVPLPISRVLHTALALDRADRPAHAAALRQQLRDAAHEANITLDQAPLPPIVQPAAHNLRQRRWYATALLALALLVIAGSIWLPQLAIRAPFSTGETAAPATATAATDDAQLLAGSATAAQTATIRAATQIAGQTATIARQTAAARQATAAQATSNTLATRQAAEAQATAAQDAILAATRTAIARRPTAPPAQPPQPIPASPAPETTQSPAPASSSPPPAPAQSPAPLLSSPSALPEGSPAP
jgi:tRNA A-37 threonylcarbamoyl transferase component Bud32